MTVLLVLLCGINILIGSWFVWTLFTIDLGAGSIDWWSPDTLIYLLSTLLAFVIPAVSWGLRYRWRTWLLLTINALPLVLLLLFSDFKLFIRWE